MNILNCTLQHHLHIITPDLAELPIGAQMHNKEWIPAKYPFTSPGSRETIVDKMPCLRAYALCTKWNSNQWPWVKSSPWNKISAEWAWFIAYKTEIQ